MGSSVRTITAVGVCGSWLRMLIVVDIVGMGFYASAYTVEFLESGLHDMSVADMSVADIPCFRI